MPTDRRIVFRTEEIEVLEAVIFQRFGRGVDVEIRALDDGEPQVRSRLKGDLIQYTKRRAAGYPSLDLLREILYQLYLYCAIVPGYSPEAILCMTDLCAFAMSLPGKTPDLDGLHAEGASGEAS